MVLTLICLNFIRLKQFNPNIFWYSVYRVENDCSWMSWYQTLVTHMALKSFLLVNLNYLLPSFIIILSDYICLNFDVCSYNITYFPFGLDTVLLLKSSCLTIKAICSAFFYFVLHMPCFNASNLNPRQRTIWNPATKQLFKTIFFHIITNKVWV